MAVAALFREYEASLGIDLCFQGFESELASLPGKYAPPDGALLLAKDERRAPIGCVALRPFGIDGVCEMKRLYVMPKARGLGLGRALVAEIVEAGTLIGYREMRLDTLPSMQAAISLYSEAGFQPIEPYYETPLAQTVFMARALL